MDKVLPFFAGLMLVAGCSTTKPSAPASANLMPLPVTMPVASKLARRSMPVVGVTNVTLTWVPNYIAELTNEVTVIIQSDDLTVPRRQWAKVFVGATNQCTFPMTNGMMFFSVYNDLIQ